MRRLMTMTNIPAMHGPGKIVDKWPLLKEYLHSHSFSCRRLPIRLHVRRSYGQQCLYMGDEPTVGCDGHDTEESVGMCVARDQCLGVY